VSSRAGLDLEWQRYRSIREQANADWHRLARLSALIAEQFMVDRPHGGDLDALRVTFVSATQTREAVAQYRSWLTKQQGGAP
jgi:hypothetical protein